MLTNCDIVHRVLRRKPFRSPQTQMERHSSTAREIAEQRKQVDQVVSYGRKVMEDSSHNGDIVEEIQGELGKLEDEYKNLQEKSDQLGVSAVSCKSMKEDVVLFVFVS